MKTVDIGQHLAAAAMALSVTFSVVWALSSYAYAKPADARLAQLAEAKSCRG
jgi:hypothetical protein